MRHRLRLRLSFAAALVAALATVELRAQAPADTTPSFTLATNHMFSTRERPAIFLTFAHVDHLDFRVYKVKDTGKFFEQLREPHNLGGFKPDVPQEPTLLERIAAWKAGRRRDVVSFFRSQLSLEYRLARRERADKQVVQRRTVNLNTFAQVPVLNASQLVTSWRELLPRVRDIEYRRIPLEISAPGVYVVEAVDAPRKAYTIVVISDAGLVTKTAPGELLAFAANRFTGDPLAGCKVRVLLDQKTVSAGETGADGAFHADIAAGRPESLVTLAQCGEHPALADPGAYTIRQPARELVGYIYTDRPVYRPGHLVHYKAVLRWREKDVLQSVGRDPVEIRITDGRRKVLLRERRPVDEFGALTGSFAIPAAASLGNYSVHATIGDRTADGTFEVQEYRKPEFDVAVRPNVKRELQGKTVTATIAARYYFGQPVAGGSVKYSISRQQYYSDFDRGPDGDGGEFSEREGGGAAFGDQRELEGTARLNDQGLVEIPIALPVHPFGSNYAVHIEAHVTDVSGRDVAGGAQVVATYGAFMVQATADRFVQSPGATAEVNLRAIDYDGNPQAGVRMSLTLQRLDYSRRSSSTRITDLRSDEVVADATGRARWTVTLPNQSGSYHVRVSAISEGRQVVDYATFWVPGGSVDDDSYGDYRYLELVADQRSYRPGDTAHLAVRGAEFDSFVLVTKENQHVSYYRVIRVKSSGTIDVPIEPGDIGDTYVAIAFLKDDRLYRAERRLVVPATERRLTVTAAPDRAVSRPGEPGLFTLHVTDSAGAPVRAQLSLGLVDEALYGVKADTTPDPLRFFYRREYSEVGTSFSRDYPFTGYSGSQQLLLARRHQPMTFADFKADRPDRPKIRKEFPDTAFWAGDVTTNADGNAQIHVDYPDSLTTWRLTARAVTVSTDVGSAIARTLTTKDMILRVVPPRFLNEGDQVSIPAIVHNYLPDGKAVTLSMTAEGLSAAGGPSPRSINVPSNGQQRSDWKYKAEQVRQVTLTGKAISDTASDAMQVSLPVLPAGLQRNAGTSGSILDAEPRALDLTVPPSANVSGRSIRVALMPSLAGSMLGALDYLTSYPWGCTEQTVSSFVPNLVVMRALERMKIAPPERLQSLDRRIDDGLTRLYGMQHDDGGWGWWKTDENQPFMTAYAVDGLLQARENKVSVAGYAIYKGVAALESLYAKYPRAIPDLKAYEVYVLARAGDQARSFNLASALDDLWSARSRMDVSGLAYLLMTLDARKDARGNDIARAIAASVKTRGDLAWWEVARDPFLDDIIVTDAEGSALALRALAARDPRNPLLERVARWLVLKRTAGYWYSTKQTAIALQGLLAYMQARGEQPAPFTADVFVNGARVATQSFDAASLVAPNPVLVESPAVGGVNNVRILKRGAGALYYDATVRYYDKPAAAERTGSRRLAITRTYSTLVPVTDKSGHIVYKEGAFSGTAKPGDLLLVRLTAAGSADWKYLMLEDPIPAGTEAVEQERSFEIDNVQSWWFGTREFRDDRTVYFMNSLYQGRADLAYLLKVTTPGTFTAMPARISPMYIPEVSASSAVISLTVPADGAQ